MTVHHRYATVDGQRLFYREAGSPDAPTIVLLHGFPTSSYMFRDLIPGWPTATTSSRLITSVTDTPTHLRPPSSTTASTRSRT